MLATLGRGLDALTLGEDAAQALGIRLTRLRLTLVIATASVVGAATAVAGAIGFVGLVVPHILRPLVGARPSRLLFASALGGAVLVLAADIAVRLILPDDSLYPIEGTFQFTEVEVDQQTGSVTELKTPLGSFSQAVGATSERPQPREAGNRSERRLRTASR